MEFHWHGGNCLPAEEWKTIAYCMQQIGEAIYQPYLGGCTENGKDYYAVDFISTPDEIKELAEILNDFVKSFQKEEAIYDERINKAEQCLIDNGIEPDEAQTVLQALGYILLDEELYPEE